MNLSDVHHLDQYFGLWLMHEATMRTAVAHFERMNLHMHMQSQREAAPVDKGKGYLLSPEGVAIVSMVGPLTKYDSSLADGPGTVSIRQAIRAAARDGECVGIMLLIDSPGGTAAGVADLADEVRRAARAKPVHAYIEDMGASAAYWVASQAQRLTANSAAIVGSIGVYMLLVDSSKSAEQEGLKVHVVRVGDYKGMGAEGTEITEEQLADAQRNVQDIANLFHADVLSGRKMTAEQLQAAASGQVWIAADCVPMRLLDGVETFNDALAAVVAAANASPVNGPAGPVQKEQRMAAANEPATTAPAVASLDELKAINGVTPAFIVSCMEKRLTVPQAQAAWINEQAMLIAAKDKEIEAASAKAAPVGYTGTVTDKRGTGKVSPSASGTATEQYRALVAEFRSNGMSLESAVGRVHAEHPDIQKAYVDEYNAAHPTHV